MAFSVGNLQFVMNLLVKHFKDQTIYSRQFYEAVAKLGEQHGLKEVAMAMGKADLDVLRIFSNQIVPNPSVNNSYVWFATQPNKDYIQYEQRPKVNKKPSAEFLWWNPTEKEIPNKKYVEKYSLEDYTLPQDQNSDSGDGDMSSGYQYINNPARRKYRHMRMLLQNHWSYNKTIPSEQFDIDGRFQYNIEQIADWLNNNLTVSDINAAHARVNAWYDEINKKEGGKGPRGRPPGARNKNKVREEGKGMSAAERAELDALADELSDDTAETSSSDTATQSSANTDKTELNTALLRDLLRNYVTYSDLAKNYATISDVVNANNDMSKALTDLLKSEIKKIQLNIPRELIITNTATQTSKNIGIQHKSFDVLLAACLARMPNGDHLNLWLYGPAGTGKSTAAIKVASVLNMDYVILAKLDAAFQIWGHMSADGTYIGTPFRKAWENGGVIILEEVDGFSPQAALALNGALANGVCGFPDKVVERHKDCIVIAGANTTGLGGTDEYVGRTKLDAATLDRFIFVDWPIDDALEAHISSSPAWLEIVRAVRRNVKSIGLKNVLITPRATLNGEALLKQGIAPEVVMQMVLKKGMSEAQWNQVKPSVSLVDQLRSDLAAAAA